MERRRVSHSAKVRPKPQQPLYYEWQHGLLILVLYAPNPEHAAKTATTIVEELPYELIADQFAVPQRAGLLGSLWRRGQTRPRTRPWRGVARYANRIR